uniref:EasG n=1 Tax=Claviceps gigantea TaxID=89175 RepID=A0A2H4P5C9_9HYPO|nr:EasG [Claviceps gigantea]
MTILLTGGNGKTARHIARLLKEADVPFIIGSRSSTSEMIGHHRSFDWLDEATFGNTLSVHGGMEPISIVWLVPPPILDLAPPVISFINFANSKGVKRFVLLSGSIIDKGGPAMGQIHAHLDSLEGISYSVLRPTWFMENFSTRGDLPFETIRKEGKFYSATKDGKIPLISVMDIARVAFHALTAPVLEKEEHILLGPELLTYDDVAETLSRVLGRNIIHARVTESELAEKLQDNGLTAEDAAMQASLDLIISAGGDERLNTEVRDLTGQEPRRFSDFVSENKHAWIC